MLQEKLDRINELARKSRITTLSNDELEEQKKLRQEYIEGYRKSLRAQLDNIIIVDEKGNKKSLKK